MNNRQLSVFIDGIPIAEGCRLFLSGSQSLDLYPCLMILKIYNLSACSSLRLKQGGKISVSRGLSLIAEGEIQDMVQQTIPSGVLTTVGFSFGLPLWQSSVSLSLDAGLSASETIRHLLAASGCGVQLLSFPEEDPVFARPQAFFGRLPDAIRTVLSALRAKACLVPGGLIVLPEHAETVDVEVTEADLVDEPELLPDHALICTLPTGWPMGRRVKLTYRNQEYTGQIISHELAADTAVGPFHSQLWIRKET